MQDPELPPPTPEERELCRKLQELAVLEETLSAREQAVASAEVELRVFEVQYLTAVGRHYAELDTLQAEVLELEAARAPQDLELQEQAEAARARAQDSVDALGARRSEADPRAALITESLKKLFRQVARAVHPDLAEDAESREKRQGLMAAANRAYETGDETRLVAILKDWEESPEAVRGHSPGAELLRAVRRIARVEEQIAAADTLLVELQDSPLFHLRARVERAEVEGRDLLAEMAAALEPEIARTRARLQQLRTEEGP